MTPDELKDNWRRLGCASPSSNGTVPPEEIDRIVTGRITGARQRLIRQYKRMWTVFPVVGMIPLIPLSEMFPLWVILCFVVFYLTAAVMDYYLWRGIRSIDLNIDGVEEVVGKARFYRRKHHQFQCILIPIAAALIGMLVLWALEKDPYMFYGIIVGLLIGLPAGLFVYFRIMRNYRSMM